MNKNLFSLLLMILTSISWGCGGGLNGLRKQFKIAGSTSQMLGDIETGEELALVSKDEESLRRSNMGKYEFEAFEEKDDDTLSIPGMRDPNEEVITEFRNVLLAIEKDTGDGKIAEALVGLKKKKLKGGSVVLDSEKADKLPQAINFLTGIVNTSTEKKSEPGSLTTTQANSLGELSEAIKDIVSKPEKPLDWKVLEEGRDALKALLLILSDKNFTKNMDGTRITIVQSHKKNLESLSAALVSLFKRKV